MVSVELPREIVVKFRDNCHADLGNHPWKEICRDGIPFGVDHVVRWCPLCGSIVIDTEFDGRLMPGAVRAITSPQIASKMSWDGKG